MINVEGYKCFRGIMRISPKIEGFKPIDIYGEWLYKPDTCCWYGKGSSYHESICEIVNDKTK